jgi:hypothetical protein
MKTKMLVHVVKHTLITARGGNLAPIVWPHPLCNTPPHRAKYFGSPVTATMNYEYIRNIRGRWPASLDTTKTKTLVRSIRDCLSRAILFPQNLFLKNTFQSRHLSAALPNTMAQNKASENVEPLTETPLIASPYSA